VKRDHHGSRLWPVLTVLFLLVGGALALEFYARTRDPEAIVVAVRAQSAAAFGGDEESDDDGDELEADPSAALDADHASARELGRRGDVAGAIAALRAQTQAHPEQAARFADLGYFLLVDKQPREAQTALEQARALGWNNPFTSLHLGVALRRQGQLPQAEGVLRHSLEQKPGFRAALLALAEVLRAAHRDPEAIAILTQLANSGGNVARARALLALGRSDLALRRSADADRAFERAIEWAPGLAELRISIARAYLAASTPAHVANGRNAAQTALELAPDLPEAHGALAHAQELSGDEQAAEQSYEAALRLNPDYHYARRKLLRLALERRDFSKARAHAERLLALAPKNAEHHFLSGLVAARAGAPDDARAHYAAAIDAAGGDYPEADFNLGVLEKEQKRWPEAIAAYQRAIASKPDYLAAYNNLGLAQAAAGDAAQAEAAYRKALAIEPAYWAAWLNLGKLQLGAEDYAEAARSFERAAAIKPSAHEALLDLGVAYRKGGRIDDAIATYRKLIASAPRYASAHYNLGIALERAGDRQRARAAYEQALSIDGEHVLALRHLAALLASAGELGQARARYEAVIDQDPSDQKAWLALADVHRRRGDVAACTRAVHAACAESGRDDEPSLLSRCKSQHDGAPLQL
jgi:tetratricopeptide (TPR) repeat protein